MNKQIMNEIEFALQHGFTDIKRTVENDGSKVFIGTFGYVAVNETEAAEIENLIAQYTTTAEKVETFEDKLNELFKDKYIVKSQEIKNLLNNKLKSEVTFNKSKGYYRFEVEGDTNIYALIAKQQANGIWRLLHSRSSW